YRFVTHKVGGEQFVVSAVVHMDEKTPHMHVAFIPTVAGKDRKGRPCRRVNASEFWKGKDSYSRLQDEYHEWITSCGYALERGTKGSTAEHLSVEEYKLQKTSEQLAELQEQVEEVKAVDEIGAKNLPFNMVSVRRDDFNTLAAAAKGYVTAKAAEAENAELTVENERLFKENEQLRAANADVNAKYMQLDHDYGAFYDSVTDEVALRDENVRLSAENGRLGDQLHIARSELTAVKTENAALRKKVSEQEQQITAVKAELSNLQRLYNSLREQFEKVKQFVEQHGLGKALREFLEKRKNKAL
nr:plasmid recombination protein [Ruminococcus sp.]